MGNISFVLNEYPEHLSKASIIPRKQNSAFRAHHAANMPLGWLKNTDRQPALAVILTSAELIMLQPRPYLRRITMHYPANHLTFGALAVRAGRCRHPHYLRLLTAKASNSHGYGDRLVLSATF